MVNGEQQAVPINAAAANLLGVLKMDAKNYAGAKVDFQQALTLFPILEVQSKILKYVKKSETSC